MTARTNPSNGPLWFIAGIVGAGIIAWIALMWVMMFAWGGWDWGWHDMRTMMHSRGTNTADSTLVFGGMQEEIEIRDYAFSPGNLQVPVGATVTWTNYDSAPHNAVNDDDAWATDILDKGESASITFDERGDYDYFCSIHPSMRARIVVR